MSTSTEEKYSGYIVKLYKAVSSHKKIDILDEMDYLVWMNYDGMTIKKIDEFIEYQKSLDVANLGIADKTCERQKIYLYSNSSTNIFFDTNDMSPNMPLIVITMINFVREKADLECVQGLINKALYSVNVESSEEVSAPNIEEKVKYEIMGTLSSYDYVIVFRGESYTYINNILSQMRILSISQKCPINLTYSILGIARGKEGEWNGDKGVSGSVRVSLSPDYSPEKLFEELSTLNTAPNSKIMEDLRYYTTFGKYDMGIEGKVLDAERFVNLFSKDGALSEASERIYATNTRFLNYKQVAGTLASEGEPSVGDETIKLDESVSKEFNERLKQLQTSVVSEEVKQSVLRLILRMYQVAISIYPNNIKQYLRLLDGLISLIKKKGQLSHCQELLADIVTALNILLDNQVSANIRDFEVPQSNLRFSGASYKLLIAYSNVINSLTKIINTYKAVNDNKHDYYVFVTVDIDTKISSRIFFPTDEEIRFLHIRIPVELMYDVEYALPWLTHEMGHFFRTFERVHRNRAYFRSVFSMFLTMVPQYIRLDNGEGYRVMRHIQICDARCCSKFEVCNNVKECYFKRFDDYEQLLINYWGMFISYAGYKRESYYKIEDRKKGLYIQEMKEVCHLVKNAYEEAIADIFMLTILGIKQGNQYLKIIIKYFWYNQITISNELSGNIVIRIIAVLMYIFSSSLSPEKILLNKKSMDSFQNYIKEVKTESDSEDINKLCTVILNKCNLYPAAQILCKFLIEFVGKKTDDFFGQNEDIKKGREKIYNHYCQIIKSPKDFGNYINFIKEFQNLP